MKVIDHLNQAKSPLFSFEILPPLKGKHINEIFDGIDPLMEFDPSFINVTYHREEYIYKEHDHGLLEKVSVRKRPGTVGICAAIINKYEIDAVPHLICGGFSKEETENALIDLNFLGIDNVLALRGDPIRTESNFVAEPNGHKYAVDLVRQVKAMNQGQFLHDEIKGPFTTDFCIGSACYPEKHFEALNLKTDIAHLKQKVEAGAEYLVTQMFFDNKKYVEFVTLCRENGIEVPIIPGLKPITTLRHISFIPKTFNVDLPDGFAEELVKCRSNEEVKKVGVEWMTEQAKELLELGAPCLHFYTMGKSDAVRQIVKEVF